ncbi:ABC transporter permease [Ureibacillus aquaedulcis]|uniref:ABC transporter permease n=1 Tax=Ureibacillus aquaedulcis TaxID=3058421 RepID=A0ABT8GMU8_9BACL|nr:ABC transporter permease [Ureibacillus sp. BA0131]MDN4492729.1 ABC transporter permease [Ureibacillus sp. BA0131]
MLLFKMRLQRQWKTHLSLFKNIADWTIWLYLIIPSFAFIYYLLRETVFKLNYGFIEFLHPGIVVFIIMYISSTLINRTFSEPADKLFLIQSTKQYAALKRWGFYYSLLCNFAIMAILFSLFYPFLRYVHHFSFIQLTQFSASLISCYLVSKLSVLFLSKWVRFFTLLILILLTSVAVFYANDLTVAFTIALIFIGGILYERRAIRTHRYFEKQTQMDVESFYRWQSRIFLYNPELKMMKLPKHKSKSPMCFKKGRSNDSVSVLIELILKTIFRKKSYIWDYLRIICIVFPLILVVPWWAAYLLVILMYFGLKTYISSICAEVKENAIFTIIRTSDRDWQLAFKKIQIYIVNSVTMAYVALITCLLLFF